MGSAGERWVRLMPVMFVLLWSTGFIGAKYGLPYADPFTFLGYRMLTTALLLGALAGYLKVSWPRGASLGHQAVAGLLVHGLYLGGVFYAIELGMPAGMASLVVGLQPLLTALLAVAVLRERLGLGQWLGLLLGFIGVGLVVSTRLSDDPRQLFDGFSLWALVWVAIALVAISAGTVYQKRFGGQTDLVAGTSIQYAAATLFFAVGALLWESGEFQLNWQLGLTFLWLVFGLSIGAILLLMSLIRRGEAARVASLFYLVPPVTALEAYLLFGEVMEGLALFGGALTVAGVALVISAGQRRSPAPPAGKVR